MGWEVRVNDGRPGCGHLRPSRTVLQVEELRRRLAASELEAKAERSKAEEGRAVMEREVPLPTPGSCSLTLPTLTGCAGGPRGCGEAGRDVQPCRE